jgi:cation-dependent mannose-6-phosphate receptor
LKAAKDYQFETSNGYNFILNVCKSVAHESWNLKVPNPADVAGFIRRPHGDFSIGTANSTLILRGGRPSLQLIDGSPCAKDNTIRSYTTIEFVCDTSIFGAGKPRLVTQFPEEDDDACAFFVEWRSHFACPTSDRTGAHGLFILAVIIIIALVMLYLVCGTLYNRFVLNLSGFDQIPQFSWTSLKYHVSEAAGNIREAFDETQRLARQPNPHSHQAMHGSVIPDGNRSGEGTPNAGPNERVRRFDLEQAPSTREEQESMIRAADDDDGEEDTATTPTPNAPGGMDPQGVIRL